MVRRRSGRGGSRNLEIPGLLGAKIGLLGKGRGRFDLAVIEARNRIEAVPRIPCSQFLPMTTLGRSFAARGHTTQQIADRLFIAPRTADHHIQHIYNKICVSTRAAAALWAMQHAVVQ